MIDEVKKYRPNVAVIVTDGEGNVLLCYRATEPVNAVQTVQGGIDEGETVEQAAGRELCEELGLTTADFVFIAKAKNLVRYDWTPEVRARPENIDHWSGQEQQFFLAQVSPDTIFHLALDHAPEFNKVAWATPEEMLALVAPVKRPGIENALREFNLL